MEGLGQSFTTVLQRHENMGAHWPWFTHLNEIATADMQIIPNFLPILPLQLMNAKLNCSHWHWKAKKWREKRFFNCKLPFSPLLHVLCFFTRPDRRQVQQGLLSLLMCIRIFFPCWCTTGSSFPAGLQQGPVSLLFHTRVFFPYCSKFHLQISYFKICHGNQTK